MYNTTLYLFRESYYTYKFCCFEYPYLLQCNIEKTLDSQDEGNPIHLSITDWVSDSRWNKRNYGDQKKVMSCYNTAMKNETLKKVVNIEDLLVHTTQIIEY